MYSYIFGCNDVALKVESNSEKLIDDLTSLYGNYYNDRGIVPKMTIRYLENNILDFYEVMDREDENDTYNFLSFDSHTNILTVCFNGKYGMEKKEFVQRIMCNAFIMEFQRNGYVIIHGACLAKDGNAFIFSGNKGAGKTTTLLKLLERGYDFISNDKVAVKAEEDHVVCCGIPHSMGIVKGDIDFFNIDKNLGRVDGPKIYFRVADLGRALNVDVRNKAKLTLMVFPKYEIGRKEIDIIDCCDNLSQLGEQNVFKEEAVAPQKGYLIKMLPPIGYVDASCINKVPGIVVKQGADTFSQLSSFMCSSIKEKIK